MCFFCFRVRSGFLFRGKASEDDDSDEVEEGNGQAEQPPVTLCGIAQSAAACCDPQPEDGNPQKDEGSVERRVSCCQAMIGEGSFHERDDEGNDDEGDDGLPVGFLGGFAVEGEEFFHRSFLWGCSLVGGRNRSIRVHSTAKKERVKGKNRGKDHRIWYFSGDNFLCRVAILFAVCYFRFVLILRKRTCQWLE